MKNEINQINNIENKDNFLLLKQTNRFAKIPKLYQKKRVSFFAKVKNVQIMSSKKEHINCTKLFQTKTLLNNNNYINLYNKSKTINYNLFKNNTLNKSNINTINTTSNNSNSNLILNNTNNNSINNINNNTILNNQMNNSVTNIMSNNLFNSNTFKNTINYTNNSIQENLSENIDEKKNDIFNESNENADINDETEENIPVHISNYKGGLKGNRDWGFSKSDAKGKLISKGKIKNIMNSYNRKNDDNLKFQSLFENSSNIKKRLLYDEKNKLNTINNKQNDFKNDTNIKNNTNSISNKILFSPNINYFNKIKRLNFDQPFKYTNLSKNKTKNEENNKVTKIPKLMISLTKKDFNPKLKIFNYETSGRDTEKNKKRPILINSEFKNNKYSQTEENFFNKNKIKKGLFSLNINESNLGKNYFHSKSLLKKFNQVKNNQESFRSYNNYNSLIHSYSLKKKNINLTNCSKLIRHIKININNISKINLDDIIFSLENIKFKNYIENFLDNKSIIIISSINKKFHKNFRHLIYNKYYNNIILNRNNNKKHINQIITSVLKYSSDKLKNLSKEDIKQIYNSFNYKSIYNENIIKDLTRTFPNDKTFNKNSLGYYKLYNILTSYSNFNKQIGYTQGLNFICAIGLTLFDKEEEVFVFLDGLINRFELDSYMGINNKNLVKNLGYFSKLLNKYDPEIISFFNSKLLNHEFFSTNWILTLFSNCMDRECLVIVWCFMIIFGWKFFYCFSIELLKYYSYDILKTDGNAINYKMKQLLNNDIFEQNLSMIIKNTFQLMKNNITL